MSELKHLYPTPAISRIALRGFKSFATERQVEIFPLTLLAGANSSGKSSLFQPPLLLKQTLEAPHDPGALRPEGPHVHFTSADQLLTRIGRRGTEAFCVRIDSTRRKDIELEFRLSPGGLFDVARMGLYQSRRRFELRPGMAGTDLDAVSALSPALFGALAYIHGTQAVEWKVLRNRCFLDLSISIGNREEELGDILPSSFFSRLLLELIHVPGLRGNPERAYRVGPVGERFPGPFQSYTASVIAVWQREKDERLALLNKALSDLGLTRAIETRSVDASQAEVLVDRKAAWTARGAHDLINLADVGFGVSQVLPVLVALLVARPGQLVYIEQPELHLHPGAQQALAGILADAAKRGVRVVAETHSDILLLAVQALVAEGALDPDLVKLHWFSRNAKGITEVSSADLDAFGAYGDWPEDFGAVDAEVQNRYLDAVEARARGGRKRGKGK